jgi:NAD(P)-dependent dehydrogenase (short-subunit alcohol dehydrogenase family)
MIQREGGTATFLKADVSRFSDVEALVNRTLDEYGRLDYAVNNAGVPSKTNDEEEWDRVIGINLKGVWLCSKAEALWMEGHGGGAIINVASIGSFKGAPGMEPYCASKHGVIGVTKSSALAYAKNNIRVNAVCPGTIDTPMVAAERERWEEVVKNGVPMGRMGLPEEVAEAIVWLCSDAAAFITGVALPVDGGVMAR